MNLSYGKSVEAWEGFRGKVESLIQQSAGKSVCEIGGGANPLLEMEMVRSKSLNYTVLDISAEELAKAPDGYHKVLADICSDSFAAEGVLDFAFSKMLAEHVRDGETFHSNVHKLLRPGGIAFHFFPTLFAPPFVANKVLPEDLASAVLNLVNPRDRYQKGKFKAYYSWCRGPTQSQIKKFQSIGFEIVEFRGFFGHDAYYRKIPPMQKLSRALAGFLVKHPLPQLTSYAYLVVKKV